MSKDISTQYTKEQNKKNGHKGFYMYKNAKIDVISPKNYGMFINNRGSKKCR